MTWLLLAVVSLCEASPALFHSSAESAVSDTQRVLFRQDEGAVFAEYEVLYDGDATSFGWMIPVFGELVEVGEDDEGTLDALLEASSPEVAYVYPDGDDTGDGLDDGGIGCACGETAYKTDGSTDDSGEVTALDTSDTGGLEDADVIAEGFTGTYTWQLIEADTTEALTTWLSDNGWQEGDQQETLEAYVAEGGVTWLCVKLAVEADDATTADAGRALPPLTVTWSGETMRYPAILAKNGEATSQRTTLLVLGESDATITAGWDVVKVGSLYGESLPGDQLIDTLSSLSSAAPTYALLYAGDYEDQRLTRLDTLTARELHSADATLGFTGTTDDVETLIEVETDARRRVSGAGLLGLLGALVLSRRRGDRA